MRRLAICLLIYLFFNSSYSQETKFNFSIEGFTDFVVIDCEGKTQNELFEKTLNWIAVTFKEPNEVIKAKIENEYIRFEGLKKSLICLTQSCYDTRYQIEISFKDNKYKFDIIKIEYYMPSSKLFSATWSEVRINEIDSYYKKGKIKGLYKRFPEDIPNYFNNLNLDLKEFILSDKIPSKKDDW